MGKPVGIFVGVSVRVFVGIFVEVSVGPSVADRVFLVGAAAKNAVEMTVNMAAEIVVASHGPPRCSATCRGTSWRPVECSWNPVEGHQ